MIDLASLVEQVWVLHRPSPSIAQVCGFSDTWHIGTGKRRSAHECHFAAAVGMADE
jgi:hypothetical protein